MNPRMLPMLLGTGIGLGVGVVWTMIFGPVFDGPPSITLTALVSITGLSFTGFAVGLFPKNTFMIGSIAGGLSMSTLAFIVGPRDGWIVIWLFLYGGSGIFCGCIIAGVYSSLQNRSE